MALTKRRLNFSLTTLRRSAVTRAMVAPRVRRMADKAVALSRNLKPPPLGGGAFTIWSFTVLQALSSHEGPRSVLLPVALIGN